MAFFETGIVVRFAHVDAAGIVFYPRYFEMVNQVIEDWFAGPLGCNFRCLHGQLGLGIPTVSVECQFLRPSRLGDELTFGLRVEQLGRTSVTLAVTAECADERRLRARLVLVGVDLDTARATPLPGHVRSRMAEFALPPTV